MFRRQDNEWNSKVPMSANGRTVPEYSVRLPTGFRWATSVGISSKKSVLLPTGIRWVRSVGISSKNPFYFRPESVGCDRSESVVKIRSTSDRNPVAGNRSLPAFYVSFPGRKRPFPMVFLRLPGRFPAGSGTRNPRPGCLHLAVQKPSRVHSCLQHID